MNIFDSNDYRKIIKNWISRQPKKGWGVSARLASDLSMPASVFSQILSGSRDLPLEGAYILCENMHLIEIEKEYFLALVQRDRSSHHKLKNYFQDKVKKIREESKNLNNRVPSEMTLTEQEQAIFYSSWIYSAIRMRSSLKKKPNAEELARDFHLSEEKLSQILSFLLAKGLIVSKDGRFDIGPLITFLPKDSPHITKHHSNWRLKAIDRAGHLEKEDLMFTAPLSCSRSDYEAIQSKLSQCIQDISKMVKDSDPEVFAYLGMDFFKV